MSDDAVGKVLDELAVECHSGSGLALFSALRICATAGRPLPEWTNDALRVGMQAYLTGLNRDGREVRDLGAAFKVGPSPATLETRNRNRPIGSLPVDYVVKAEIERRLNAGEKTTVVFDDVGRQYGVSRGTACAWYYDGRDFSKK